MVWGKDRCGAACVRGQLYFRRMRVIRTEKMLIENADMIVTVRNNTRSADTTGTSGSGICGRVPGGRGPAGARAAPQI